MNLLTHWVIPGLLTVGLLTFGADLLKGDAIEADLSKKVERALAKDHPWAEVDLQRRDVVLRGTAPTEAAAEDALGRITAVYDIANIEDVSGRLPVATPYFFSAARTDGGFVLEGNAPDIQTREAILKVAKKAASGAKIDDKLELAAGAPGGFLDIVSFGMELMPSLKTPVFSLEDQEVKISGQSSNLAVFEKLTSRLGDLPSGFTLAENTMQPPPASPYRWSITKRSNGVTLRGNIPSEDQRDAVLALAQSLAGTTEINDLQVLASGAPAGFDQVREVLTKYVAMLSAGQASLADSSISLAGRIADQETAEAIKEAINNELPDGFSVVTNFIVEAAQMPEPVAEQLPLADPFEWKLVKGEDGILLSGHVDSKEQAQRIVGKVERNFPGISVTDDQQPARGGSENISEIRDLMIRQMRLIDVGQAILSGNTLELTGKTKNKNLASLIDRVLQSQLPEGYQASTEIGFPETKPVIAPQPTSNAGSGEETTQNDGSTGSQETASQSDSTLSSEQKQCQQSVLNAINGRNIGFQTARAIMLNGSNAVLDDVLAAAAACPQVRFRIEGHTDSRGRKSYNRELSKARAQAVVEYLRQAGADVSQFEAVGFGEDQPLADNTTAEGRALNRRIVFNVVQ